MRGRLRRLCQSVGSPLPDSTFSRMSRTSTRRCCASITWCLRLTLPARPSIRGGRCRCWRLVTPWQRSGDTSRRRCLTQTCGRNSSKNLEDEKVGRMETRHPNVVEILIRVHYVAADEGSKLFNGHTQFLGGFSLRVLALRQPGCERKHSVYRISNSF